MSHTRLTQLASFLLVAAFAGCVCVGCARPLKRYPLMSDEEATQTIAARLASVHTLSAACEITLFDAQQNAVRLDGALAASLPERLRLRAWKFNQAVFDLTLKPEGLWIFWAEKDADRERDGDQFDPRQFSASQIGDAWKIFTGGFFADHPSPVIDAPEIRFRSYITTLSDGTRITCVVDRSTLTPTQYEFVTSDGALQYALRVSRYQTMNDIVWPTILEFQSPTGRLSLRLKDIEINGELPESAFAPPPRAVRQP